MNEKTLTTYVTTNIEIRHFRIVRNKRFVPLSLQTFPKATLFPISPGYYREDITVVRSCEKKKAVLMQNLVCVVLGGGGKVERQTRCIREQCNSSE